MCTNVSQGVPYIRSNNLHGSATDVRHARRHGPKIDALATADSKPYTSRLVFGPPFPQYCNALLVLFCTNMIDGVSIIILL